jgi:hypothetical protein
MLVRWQKKAKGLRKRLQRQTMTFPRLCYLLASRLKPRASGRSCCTRSTVTYFASQLMTHTASWHARVAVQRPLNLSVFQFIFGSVSASVASTRCLRLSLSRHHHSRQFRNASPPMKTLHFQLIFGSVSAAAHPSNGAAQPRTELLPFKIRRVAAGQAKNRFVSELCRII